MIKSLWLDFLLFSGTCIAASLRLLRYIVWKIANNRMSSNRYKRARCCCRGVSTNYALINGLLFIDSFVGCANFILVFYDLFMH